MTGPEQLYGNRVRIRVCGLCWESEKLLMVDHDMQEGGFWAPPGGGPEFGESLSKALEREFLEETGLIVEAGAFLFGCEYIKPPLHAVELFFDTRLKGGILKKGNDPELDLIRKVAFMDFGEILGLPAANVHGIFRFCRKPADLGDLKGFLRI